MEKAHVAEAAGAIGAIIYNSDQNDIDSAIDMIDDESGLVINIPVLWIVGKNGHMMVESMLDVRFFIAYYLGPIFLLEESLGSFSRKRLRIFKNYLWEVSQYNILRSEFSI